MEVCMPLIEGLIKAVTLTARIILLEDTFLQENKAMGVYFFLGVVLLASATAIPAREKAETYLAAKQLFKGILYSD